MNLDLGNKRKLFAGPWIGEFGWELFCWHGVIRKIKKDNPSIEIVCGTRPGRDFLYKDFAKVVHYDPQCGADQWFCENRGNAVQREVSQMLNAYEEKDFFIFRPKNYENQFDKMELLHFGRSVPNKKYDVLIHARNRSRRPEDNWDENKWEELLSRDLGRVGAIGSKDQAVCPHRADDLRDIPLSDLADHCYSSSVIVGPSSGPMHFGALCGCPQVVWSARRYTINRYEKTWNPFKVKCVTALAQSPSPTDVVKMMEEIV